MNIILKNDSFTAQINPIGAELKSFKDKQEKEFIWSGSPEFWSGVSPLLFPIVGNLRNGKTIINGREYKIPKHGFVRDKEFAISEQTMDSVVFTFESTDETLAIYPFHFRLSLKYELKAGSLLFTYQVENTGITEMPFHIGAHPGFLCPLKSGESFEDYVLEFEQKETALCPVYDLEKLQINNEKRICLLNSSNILPLDYSLFDQDAVIFDNIKSRKVSLKNHKTQKGVAVDFRDFNVVAFWTPRPAKAPFLCIEPWNGSAIYSDEPEEFIKKRNIQYAKPGEIKEYHMSISIL